MRRQLNALKNNIRRCIQNFSQVSSLCDLYYLFRSLITMPYVVFTNDL